jgi:hypothetical protein
LNYLLISIGILTFGGDGRNIYLYTPITNTWSLFEPSLPLPLIGCGVVTLDPSTDTIMVGGGVDDDINGNHEKNYRVWILNCSLPPHQRVWWEGPELPHSFFMGSFVTLW